jgi:hypothetical protein
MPATAVFSAAAAPVHAISTLDEQTFADDEIKITVEGCPPLCRRSERVGCGASPLSDEDG